MHSHELDTVLSLIMEYEGRQHESWGGFMAYLIRNGINDKRIYSIMRLTFGLQPYKDENGKSKWRKVEGKTFMDGGFSFGQLCVHSMIKDNSKDADLVREAFRLHIDPTLKPGQIPDYRQSKGTDDNLGIRQHPAYTRPSNHPAGRLYDTGGVTKIHS